MKLIVMLLLASSCATVSNTTALTVSPDVLERGETIYFGSSFPLTGDAAEPSFIYERRVGELDGAIVSTHITRDPSGSVAVADSATHSADYALKAYVLHTNQNGQTGSIRIDGERVTLTLMDQTATETQRLPVVVGPTLVGFASTRLGALRTGEVFHVRFAVLERLETIGFELKTVKAAEGQVRVQMTAENFFVSLAMAPIFFTFDGHTGNLMRIEGRVPPKVRSGTRWADFDGRVEYRFVAQRYR
jgi:hypothetical protein